MAGALKDTTITMSAGGQSATVSGEEFERVTDQFADAGERPGGQFQFSELAGITPETSLFTISGELTSEDWELDMGRAVRITISTLRDGEEIASGISEVKAAGAVEKKDADGNPFPARAHKLKLGA